jgi:hypothetical protein
MKKSLLKIFFFIIVLAGLPILEATYSYHAVSHIKQRHWHNVNLNPPTSRFNRSMTSGKLHSMAMRTIGNGKTMPSKNKNKVHEYRFRKPIGKATNGKNAFTLRVVTNPKGEIVTAFPTK